MPAARQPVDTIHRLCAVALAATPVDDAAVSVLSSRGHWGIVYASSPDCRRLEDCGFTLGEGPALDAFRSAAPVLVPDLTGQFARWPGYGQAAAEAGRESVFAFPLMDHSIALGALTVSAAVPTTLDGRQLAVLGGVLPALAQAVAEELDGAVRTPSSPPPDRPADSGFLRAEVYQAAGMLMVQLDVPIDHALSRLRGYAYAHERDLNQVAREVLTRVLTFDRRTGSAIRLADEGQE